MSEFAEKQELRDQFLRAAYELGKGKTGRLTGLAEVAESMGFHISNSEDVDYLSSVAEYLGEEGYIARKADGYGLLSITTKGIKRVEGTEESTAANVSNVFNIEGGVYGSVMGTHNTAELTNTFDFRSIEERIERDGGEDKEELKQALARVERLIERGEYLDRGALSQFSGAMERHSWFTGSVMQMLLGFATQAAGG